MRNNSNTGGKFKTPRGRAAGGREGLRPAPQKKSPAEPGGTSFTYSAPPGVFP